MKKKAKNEWYEFVEYFDPDKITPITLAGHDKQRMFILGPLGNCIVAQVGQLTPPAAIQALKDGLEEQGVPALITSENVHFARMRVCVPAEQKILNEASNGQKVVTVPVKEAEEDSTTPEGENIS